MPSPAVCSTGLLGRALACRPAKVTPHDRKAIIDLRQGGMSINALARRYKVSRATIGRIVEAVEAGTAQAGHTTPDSPAARTTPAKPSTRTRKAAAGRLGADMYRAVMEQQHGQRRLPAV